MSDNNKETEHISSSSSTNKEEQEEDSGKQGTGGLLSPIGDPAGKALETGLKPVGAGLSKITEPLGNAVGGGTRGAVGPLMGEKHERMEIVGGDNKDSYESKPEKIAGKEQTGQNPLGLDQTGRWGFRDE